MKNILSAGVMALVICAQVSAARTQTTNDKPLKAAVTKRSNAKIIAGKKALRDAPVAKTEAAPASSTTAPPINSGTVARAKEGSTMTIAGTEPAKPDSTIPIASAAAPPPPAVAATSIYRVGVGDVLDIRLLNQGVTRESTLYTVTTGGLLEYALAGDPIIVAGMTIDEISARLAEELKRRAVYTKPQVLVSVREYASHTVLVSGLVNDPGTKIIRREAVPLYVVVAEGQPKPEAARAVLISRATGRSTIIDLDDVAAMNTPVQSGDVISLTARPKDFFYIGGRISSPGQKNFHPGLTLTQAILASGGIAQFAKNRVSISRQGIDGLLVTTTYNLKDIKKGKSPDPLLQPGDRVEVGR